MLEMEIYLFEEIVEELSDLPNFIDDESGEFVAYAQKLDDLMRSTSGRQSVTSTISASEAAACDLRIHVEKAEGLLIGPRCGTYVRIEINGTTSSGKTKTIWNNNNPNYRDDIEVTSNSANSDVVVISVLMKISGHDEAVYDDIRILVKEFEDGRSDHVFNLQKKGQGAGTLHLSVCRS